MAWQFVVRDGVELLDLGIEGLHACITTRRGGVSVGPYAALNLGMHVGDDPQAVIENRRRATAAAGIALDDVVVAVQTHSPHVAIVDESHRGRGTVSADDAMPDADALVTNTPAVGLLIMVADCVPIVCWDPVARVAAAIHAGWGGTVARVTEAAVHAMTTLGTEPTNIVAVIGPSISPERYQVGQDVVDLAHAGLGTQVADQVIKPDGTGRFLFDLWAANHAVLTQAGVPASQITVTGLDSGEDRFFSDRLVRPCGRFAAIVHIP